MKLSFRRQPSLVVRTDVVLFIELHLRDHHLGAEWRPGPFPFTYTSDSGRTIGGTRRERANYVTNHIADLLYGKEGDCRRWHSAAFDVNDLYPDVLDHRGSEILIGPSYDLRSKSLLDGVLILHFTARDAGVETVLSALSECQSHSRNRGAQRRKWINRRLDGDGWIHQDSRRATSLTFMTFGSRPTGVLSTTPSRTRWPKRNQWLWRMAVPGPRGFAAPSAEDAADVRDRSFDLSGDWRGYVRSEGLALLGSHSDPGDHVANNFYRKAAFFVHGLYTDAVALGVLQKQILRALDGELSMIADISDPDVVRAAYGSFIRFKSEYWLDTIYPRGASGRLLSEYKDANDLDGRLADVERQLGVHDRHLQSVAADRLTGLVAVATIVGVPTTVAATLAAGIENATWVTYLSFMGGGLAISTGGLLHPVARRALRAIGLRRDGLVGS